ncbi:MAG: serine/threonine-protein kinase [Flavobacteriales bacterium]|jgi:serine/threonine protein kinase
MEFENYTIIKKIGEGAQGVVHLAQDKRLGRKVAIKSLHSNLITNNTQKERFVGEAKLLSQLNHPSVVTLYDYIVDANGFHLIMEFVEGYPLDDLINKISGPIQELRAIEIMMQVLEGIKHIHNRNIVHRDIKPSNIIIDKNDDVKLLDFGIAKDHGGDSYKTVIGEGVGGTPMFMSPEHVNESQITVKSDIYSLGVTLWQMLTGSAPYEGMAIGVIYSKIINDDLKDIQDVYAHVSVRMNDIIQKATHKNPEDRYDSCKSFIRALNDLKKHLIEDPTKTGEEHMSFKNIDVKVTNLADASIVINTSGCIGSELTYTGLPGSRVRITIQREGYQKYIRQFIINDHKNITVSLNQQKKSNLESFAIVASVILLITTIYLLIN